MVDFFKVFLLLLLMLCSTSLVLFCATEATEKAAALSTGVRTTAKMCGWKKEGRETKGC